MLFRSGTSELLDRELKPRGTYNPATPGLNIWNNQWGTYNINASNKPSSEFGLVPMPGITSVDVKCLNRGSIKRATVNLKCYSPEQFQIIDLLYLRIGYTMFLEWGNSLYLTNDNPDKISSVGYTLIEGDKWGFYTENAKKNSYLGFLPIIDSFRKKYNGNYDGLLCKVVNFSWSFSQDGSYDITLELISLGDVVESLKINTSPSPNVASFIRQTYSLYNDDPDTEEFVPPSPSNNWVSAYLFLQKLYLDKENNPETGYTAEQRQWTDSVDVQFKATAGVIEDGNNTILDLGGVFVREPKNSVKVSNGVNSFKSFESKQEALDFVAEQNKYLNPPAKEVDDTFSSNINCYSLDNDWGWRLYMKTFPSLDPLNADPEKKDIVYFNYNWGETDEDQNIEDKGFYMRLGHLFNFVNDFITPVLKTNKNIPIIQIDSYPFTKMYTLPYQVSLDPRVCVVNASVEKVNSKKFFPSLTSWKYVSEDKTKAYGLTMNIYVNHAQIISSLEDAKNDKGDVNLFEFLSSLCTAINKAMGGINNLEPIYDEDTHRIYIIDGSYAPVTKPDYVLDLYGYNEKKNTSTFVRNFNLKTEITNDFATMATIGSTAGGYTKGVENTMFSKWNKGLQDPWKEKYVVPPKAEEQGGDEKEPNTLYVEEFWNQRYAAWGYVLKDVSDDLFTSDKASLSDELIEKNLTTVTEFYKYCQSKIQEEIGRAHV